MFEVTLREVSPLTDLWQQVDGAMCLLMESEPMPENLVAVLKTFNRIISEAPDGSDALLGALYAAGCVYAIMGDIKKSNEYIFASGLVDLPQTGGAD